MLSVLASLTILTVQSFEGSSTPPPLEGHPPALNRMASLGNIQDGTAKGFE